VRDLVALHSAAGARWWMPPPLYLSDGKIREVAAVSSSCAMRCAGHCLRWKEAGLQCGLAVLQRAARG